MMSTRRSLTDLGLQPQLIATKHVYLPLHCLPPSNKPMTLHQGEQREYCLPLLILQCRGMCVELSCDGDRGRSFHPNKPTGAASGCDTLGLSEKQLNYPGFCVRIVSIRSNSALFADSWDL